MLHCLGLYAAHLSPNQHSLLSLFSPLLLFSRSLAFLLLPVSCWPAFARSTFSFSTALLLLLLYLLLVHSSLTCHSTFIFTVECVILPLPHHTTPPDWTLCKCECECVQLCTVLCRCFKLWKQTPPANQEIFTGRPLLIRHLFSFYLYPSCDCNCS